MTSSMPRPGNQPPIQRYPQPSARRSQTRGDLLAAEGPYNERCDGPRLEPSFFARVSGQEVSSDEERLGVSGCGNTLPCLRDVESEQGGSPSALRASRPSCGGAFVRTTCPSTPAP